MPGALSLYRYSAGDETVVCFGQRVVFRYANRDTAMRNLAICALCDAGTPGAEVARVVGLSREQVARVHARAQREGSAGLALPRGRRPKLSKDQVAGARRFAGEGRTQREIAKRFGVAQSVIWEVLAKSGPALVQEQLVPSTVAPDDNDADSKDRDSGGPENNGPGQGLARIATGVHPSRYAGAALLYPYLDMEIGRAHV